MHHRETAARLGFVRIEFQGSPELPHRIFGPSRLLLGPTQDSVESRRRRLVGVEGQRARERLDRLVASSQLEQGDAHTGDGGWELRVEFQGLPVDGQRGLVAFRRPKSFRPGVEGCGTLGLHAASAAENFFRLLRALKEAVDDRQFQKRPCVIGSEFRRPQQVLLRFLGLPQFA